MELEIRQVKPGDVALFDRVADAVFDEPVDPGRLAAYLAEPGHHMLVALRAGEVVAQVAAVIHRHPDKPTELYIDEVGVTPALQRQGIARAMLERMLALGKALGCEEAWVGTETDNQTGTRPVRIPRRRCRALRAVSVQAVSAAAIAAGEPLDSRESRRSSLGHGWSDGRRLSAVMSSRPPASARRAS